ncbi:hypothetical protein ABZ916_39735 [Streptomyces sp. NPDC046853]|uniref:hypothetical protein n=1 Tax=Streptomyces sp. NPDC046853 TaxID=3154920 RepID=UPI0033FB5AFB
MSAPLVRRPTENAALRRCDKTPKQLPPYPVLFAGLVTADAVGDRYGINLFAHAIARLGGERGE